MGDVYGVSKVVIKHDLKPAFASNQSKNGREKPIRKAKKTKHFEQEMSNRCKWF